jgi:profilin
MRNIAEILKGGAEKDKAFGEGFYIGGERYVATKIEDRSLYGRQVR